MMVKHRESAFRNLTQFSFGIYILDLGKGNMHIFVSLLMYVCMSFKLGDRETLHLGQKRIGTYFQTNTGNLVLLNLTWENRNGASCKFHESEEHPRRHGS